MAEDAGRRVPTEDIYGVDRLARSLLRVAPRVAPGSLVAVHGSPGSVRSELLRRMVWLVHQARAGGAPLAGVHPVVAWYDPWTWSRQGSLLSGVVAAVARVSPAPHLLLDRARDLVGVLQRLRLDGQPSDAPGAAFSGLESDPVDAAIDGFSALVDAARGGRTGRLLLVVDPLDRLPPPARAQLLDGLRLLLAGGADVTALVCLGRASARAAVRARDGALDDDAVDRELDELFDLAVNVPNLEVRRIGTLLREQLAPVEPVVKRCFGADALTALTAAAAHKPLGSPRVLRRLAHRVALLAEFAVEARATRELTEAQWAWVIVSERWPAFRRFMIRGGRERWAELRAALGALAARRSVPERTGILGFLEQDLLLADYLRLHADGLERDADGIFWLENLMLAAGL